MKTTLLVLALCSPALAAADPLKLSAQAHGSSIRLTITNTSDQPVTLATHVKAGLDHVDWLTVKLSGKTRRTLRFSETRTRAIRVDESIAPGASITRSVDLAFWAVRQPNGFEPLAPDTYDVEATWDTTSEASGPKLAMVAKTRLVLAPPLEAVCKDPTSTGVELLARQVGTSSVIEVGLHNTDSVDHCVSGYIQANEVQSDWLAIALDDKPSRTIRFSDAREQSARVTVVLAPGATHWTRWDLDAWAKRARNGGKPLPRGTMFWATATYDATRERDTWRGSIRQVFGFRIP